MYDEHPIAGQNTQLFHEKRLAMLLERVNNKNFKVNFEKYFLFKNGCFEVVNLGSLGLCESISFASIKERESVPLS